MPKAKTLITIGIPIYRDMLYRTRLCFEALVRRLQEQNYGVAWQHLYGVSVIPKARNIIAETFMNTSSHYLLFLDADQVFPSTIAEELLMMDKDVAGAVYVSKVPPHYPIVFKRDENKVPRILLEFPRNEIFEVDGLGTGCMLIKRKVLEAMKRPYFAMPRNYDLGLTDGEDLDFCFEAQKLGFSIWANPKPSKWVGHIGYFPFTLEDYDLHRDRAKQYGVTLTGQSLPTETQEDYMRGYIHRPDPQTTFPEGEQVESVVG